MTLLVQTPQYLVVGATNDVDLSHPDLPPLLDTATGQRVTNATGTLTLYDSAGNPVTNAQNLTVTYIAATPGFAARYRAVVPSSAALVVGSSYTAKMTMSDTLGNVRPFSVPCLAVASIPN
jgi:hypothetical protein